MPLWQWWCLKSDKSRAIYVFVGFFQTCFIFFLYGINCLLVPKSRAFSSKRIIVQMNNRQIRRLGGSQK